MPAGGESFGPIRTHPDIMSTVCEGSATTVFGESPFSLFVGPSAGMAKTGATNVRAYMTVLRSDDSGEHYRRQLQLTNTTAYAAYSSVACGLAPVGDGRHDCAVLFNDAPVAGPYDGQRVVLFTPFASGDVK